MREQVYSLPDDIWKCGDCKVSGTWPPDTGLICPNCRKFIIPNKRDKMKQHTLVLHSFSDDFQIMLRFADLSSVLLDKEGVCVVTAVFDQDGFEVREPFEALKSYVPKGIELTTDAGEALVVAAETIASVTGQGDEAQSLVYLYGHSEPFEVKESLSHIRSILEEVL